MWVTWNLVLGIWQNILLALSWAQHKTSCDMMASLSVSDEWALAARLAIWEGKLSLLQVWYLWGDWHWVTQLAFHILSSIRRCHMCTRRWPRLTQTPQSQESPNKGATAHPIPDPGDPKISDLLAWTLLQCQLISSPFCPSFYLSFSFIAWVPYASEALYLFW